MIEIHTGSFEIGDIQRYLQNVLVNQGVETHIKPNNNKLRSEIYCNRDIKFERSDSFRR